MNKTIVRVVARIVTRPDKVEAFKAVAFELVEGSRKEPGCVSYELLQNLSDPTDFTFVEQWADTAALDVHMTAPALSAALGKVGPLLAAPPDIRRYATVK